MHLYVIMKWIILSVTVLVLCGACAIGPVEITHKEGHLPKLRVNLGYEPCKIRVKANSHNIQSKIQCKWEFE